MQSTGAQAQWFVKQTALKYVQGIFLTVLWYRAFPCKSSQQSFATLSFVLVWDTHVASNYAAQESVDIEN